MSGAIIKAQVMVDPKLIERKVENLLDDKTMLQIHNLFAQMCNEYVPFLEGPLSQTLEITSKYVRYYVPYAHYQYVLHDMNQDLYGIKHYNTKGELEWIEETNRTRVYHPKATSYWDKAMILEKGEVFSKYVENILKARAKELYG